MPRYVLVNRRAGMFTNEAKLAPRAAVATSLGLRRNIRVVEDRDRKDEFARRVVLLNADAADIAAIHAKLPRRTRANVRTLKKKAEKMVRKLYRYFEEHPQEPVP